MEKYKKIAVLENEIQAQLLDDVLTQQNIPHMMRSYHDSAYDGLFQHSKGWGHVEAPENHEDEILEIIDNLSQSE
ncbi:MAG: hypothetical protein JRI53_05720 [Deltaproteobacteria bacterium]|nr:hypothetical protein [Deltaproteobacteria bacterium]MBW1984198.1 hypothetical protein [Deltaproteobacteria bacterium]MBW2181540.1 hypothetical protein [Deltaproteobacteria bacterium]